MEKKKLLKKLKTAKTVKEFGSIIILTCMAVIFASSIYSWPSPASPLGSAGLSAASPQFFLTISRPPAPRGEPGLSVPLAKVKQEKAGCTMEEVMRTAMQVRMTMEPKFVTVLAVVNFFTSFFFSMFTPKLRNTTSQW